MKASTAPRATTDTYYLSLVTYSSPTPTHTLYPHLSHMWFHLSYHLSYHVNYHLSGLLVEYPRLLSMKDLSLWSPCPSQVSVTILVYSQSQLTRVLPRDTVLNHLGAKHISLPLCNTNPTSCNDQCHLFLQWLWLLFMSAAYLIQEARSDQMIAAPASLIGLLLSLGGSITTLRNQDFKTYRTQSCRNRKHKSPK